MAARSSFGRLLFLLRAFWHCFLGGIAIRIFHLSIAIAVTALMIRVKFLADFRFRLCFEVLINALVVFIGASTVCDTSIITGCKILVRERSRKYGSGLQYA